MKLRIRDNSIRLRLSQPEVEALLRDAGVAATTAFPSGGELRYSVRASGTARSPTAAFTDGEVSVELPASAVARWATSAEVSISGEQPLSGGDVLCILVEKDFACLAPREGEDESDLFPHPKSGTAGGPC